jgi:hypothetical protein
MAPRSTRLTTVIEFPESIPLVLFSHMEPEPEEMEDNDLPYMGPMDEVDLPFYEEPRIYFTSVSARGRPRNVEDIINRRYNILLSFFVDTSPTPVHNLEIPIPISWTPRTYLAALQLSIRRRRVVIVAPENLVGPLAPTLNEVHWLFNIDIEAALAILESWNGFGVLNGGEFFVVPT